MRKQFLTELIMPDEVEKWEHGQIYSINAPTAIGKTTFAIETLKNIALKRDKKILIFSNRTILRKQIGKDIKGCKKYIDIIMYQTIEHLDRISDTKFGLKIMDDLYIHEIDFSKYEFIIFDEAHSIFTDHFDIYRENILDQFFKNIIGIYVLLSATMEICDSYFDIPEHNKKYIERNYDYIKNIYYYKKDNVNLILDSLAPNEKAILFVNNTDRGEELYNQYSEKSEFICSKFNKSHYKKRMKKTTDKIENEKCFDSQILISTKVIDNGVTIEDENVKHILIELTYDYEFIQSLGRLRVGEDQKINLYFALDNMRIESQLRYTNRSLDYLFEYYMFLDYFDYNFQDKNQKKIIRMRFLEAHAKDFNNILDYDATVNKVSLHITNYHFEQLKLIKESNYLQYVAMFLYRKKDKAEEFIEYERAFLKKEINLDNIINKKLFKDEKIMLFDILKATQIDAKLRRRTDRTNMSISSVKKIFEELGLMYEISKKIERSKKSEHPNETYWMITPKSA